MSFSVRNEKDEKDLRPQWPNVKKREKYEKALKQADFPKNSAISFSALRAT